MLIAIALDDAYFLGVLSSHVYVTWSLAAGGRLGVGNDPRYNKTRCFDPFPFPDSTSKQKQKIRDFGEKLDTHCKQVQAKHPDVTITGMYNLLEKLRAGQPFTDKDREYNNKALVSSLKQIHNGAQRQKKAIAENLERLEWFGILISRGEGGVTRWQFAQTQQAA